MSIHLPYPLAIAPLGKWVDASTKRLVLDIHNSFTSSSPKLERPKMSMDKRQEKYMVVYPYNRILSGILKDQTTYTCNNIYEFQNVMLSQRKQMKKSTYYISIFPFMRNSRTLRTFWGVINMSEKWLPVVEWRLRLKRCTGELPGMIKVSCIFIWVVANGYQKVNTL